MKISPLPPPPSSAAEVDDAIPTPEGGLPLSSRLTPRRGGSPPHAKHAHRNVAANPFCGRFCVSIIMLGLTREGKSCKTVIRPDKAGDGGRRARGLCSSLFPPRSASLLHLGGITPKGSEKDAFAPEYQRITTSSLQSHWIFQLPVPHVILSQVDYLLIPGTPSPTTKQIHS